MKKLDKDTWIKKAKDIHGGKFDYSLTMYSKATVKLKIICPEHGVQEMLPHHHIKGYGCGKCGKKQINISSGKQLTQKEFLKRVENIKGLSFDKTVYKNKREKVIVTCKIHGDYETTAEILLKGCGCRKCNERGKWNLKKKETFIKQALEKHNNLYSYEDVLYKGCFDKIKITCVKHGNFEQTPSTHLNGSGCPRCKNSKGELLIYNYLNKNNFIFNTQKTFNNCKDIRHLKFDFYLESLNVCVEYDGEQHFRPAKNNYWGGQKGYENRVKRDKIKTEFCQEKGINLLRITYQDNIENKLKEFLKIEEQKI